MDTKKLKKVDFSTLAIGDNFNYVESELTVNHSYNFEMLHSDFLELLEKNGAKYKDTPDGLKPYLGLILTRSNFSSKAVKNSHFLKSVELLKNGSVQFADIVKTYKAKNHKNGNSHAKNDYFYLTDLVNLVNGYNKALITSELVSHKLDFTNALNDVSKLPLLTVNFETEGKFRKYRLDYMSDTDKKFNVTCKVYNLVEVDDDEFEHFEMM